VPSFKPLRGKRLKALLKRLPARPGVYLMKDKKDRVIYVGKAKNLRSRVRSYFRASGDTRAFISRLDRVLYDIQVRVTASEKDALIMERELIRHHRPRYNIDLLDDKMFLSIRFTSGHDYPRMMLDRRRPGVKADAKKTGRWFGPYTSAKGVRETYRLLQSVFGLRTCPDSVFRQRKRPCLQHQMNRCLAPCVLEVPPDEYARRVEQAVLVLKGRYDELLCKLKKQMKQASDDLRYEDAARIRDRIRALERTLQRQRVIAENPVDHDVVGLFREGASGVVLLMQVRQGRWLGDSRFRFSGIEAPSADVVRQFLTQHYASGADLPKELLLPAEGRGDQQVLEDWLCEQRKELVKVAVPQRGRRMRLVETARDNAAEAYRTALATASILDDRLQRLQKRLNLSRLPHRIECFDLSTLGGQLSVGSLAVLIDGEPATSFYRRYRIREAAPDSDVDMMREVVSRRLRKVAAGEEEAPDLILLDGGRGQLGVVVALLADLGISDIDLAALAKGRSTRGRERVFLPGRKNPVLLLPQSDELFLLSRVRDEAHRFAVAYHRKLRRKRSTRSVLDEIPGVGPVLRKRLLAKFGSLKGVRAASVEELAGIKGVTPALAEKISNFLESIRSLTGTGGAGSDSDRRTK
jgi:excinuclease ABC subunit C